MGATSGINVPLTNDIYISSPLGKDNEQINLLCKKLVDLNYNILQIENSYEYNKVANCYYIIIFITPDTINSKQQIAEINAAWNYDKNIIYIITDNDYSPRKKREIKTIVQHYPWFLCSENAAILESLEGITHLLGNDCKKIM